MVTRLGRCVHPNLVKVRHDAHHLVLTDVVLLVTRAVTEETNLAGGGVGVGVGVGQGNAN